MYRLRRLCSKDADFKASIENLKLRCHNSGYNRQMVDGVLSDANSLKREFKRKPCVIETMNKVRWVVLSGSKFEKEQMNFVNNINGVLKEHHIAFEIVKSTGPTLGSQLFNNFDQSNLIKDGCNRKCFVCKTMRRETLHALSVRYQIKDITSIPTLVARTLVFMPLLVNALTNMPGKQRSPTRGDLRNTGLSPQVSEHTSNRAKVVHQCLTLKFNF